MGWGGGVLVQKDSQLLLYPESLEKGRRVGAFLRPPSPLLISKKSASDDDITGLRPCREIDR
jgi:hypothetical protein